MTSPIKLAIAGIKEEIEGRKILRISIRTMIAGTAINASQKLV
jgi:hypothetical protein